MSDSEFSGKVAIVTGAAMGIGQAVAELMAERGARVAIVDRDEVPAKEVAEALTRRGFEARAITTDVSVAAQVADCIAEVIDAWGQINIVSNNAGIARYGTVETTTESEWDEVIDINLKSVYLVCHQAIPHLKKTRGTIVNMASVQSFATQRSVAAYTTGKHAMIGLTRSMALDFAEYGVRVNAVAPGSVNTPMLRWAISLDDDPEGLTQTIRNMHPLGRIAEPSEIAEVVLFLASPKASFVTGSTIVADGGLLLPISGAPKDG
ncbi:MAG: SDR family oxidoreductase [Bauldia sp.]|nr:SDR family oxidoreductase [Bauldia sp.]